MKLKKIVSLALAGVLAVSMLAGCNFDSAASSNGGASSEAPVANSLAEKIAAGLSKDITDKVTVTADASLQHIVDVLADKATESSLKTNVTAQKVYQLYSGNASASTPTYFAKRAAAGDVNATCTDSVKQTYVFVVDTTGTDVDFVASQLISKIEDEDVAYQDDGSNKWAMAELPVQGNYNTAGTMHFDFTYTASVATATATSVTAASMGQATNVAVVVVTRTGTKVDHSKV